MAQQFLEEKVRIKVPEILVEWIIELLSGKPKHDKLIDPKFKGSFKIANKNEIHILEVICVDQILQQGENFLAACRLIISYNDSDEVKRNILPRIFEKTFVLTGYLKRYYLELIFREYIESSLNSIFSEEEKQKIKDEFFLEYANKIDNAWLADKYVKEGLSLLRNLGIKVNIKHWQDLQKTDVFKEGFKKVEDVCDYKSENKDKKLINMIADRAKVFAKAKDTQSREKLLNLDKETLNEDQQNILKIFSNICEEAWIQSGICYIKEEASIIFAKMQLGANFQIYPGPANGPVNYIYGLYIKWEGQECLPWIKYESDRKHSNLNNIFYKNGSSSQNNSKKERSSEIENPIAKIVFFGNNNKNTKNDTPNVFDNKLFDIIETLLKNSSLTPKTLVTINFLLQKIKLTPNQQEFFFVGLIDLLRKEEQENHTEIFFIANASRLLVDAQKFNCDLYHLPQARSACV